MRRGQIGISGKVKIGRSAFQFGEDELLHRIQADGSEMDRLGGRSRDKRLGKSLDEPQHLDEFALAALCRRSEGAGGANLANRSRISDLPEVNPEFL